MKTRESGMPDEATWDGFFRPHAVLATLGLSESSGDVVEFGCGYGTFTIPAAQIVRGNVHAIDIEPAMVDRTEERARAAGLTNIRCLCRDFVARGTGLPDGTAGYAMLFNILHAEDPGALLGEAKRVLRLGGTLAIVHWNYDPWTPRGPSMDIRPRPEQCRHWAEEAGFRLQGPGLVDLPPFHYGLVLVKTP